MYRGLIAAAGLSTRLQDLGDKRNKVLLDLGGESLLATILTQLRAGRHRRHGRRRRLRRPRRAHGLRHPRPLRPQPLLRALRHPRQRLAGPRRSSTASPFVFTTGDHYFALPRFQAFLADQPEADVLVDVELKACDDEDMKVFLNRTGKLRTMTKTFLEGPVLGEFTGAGPLQRRGQHAVLRRPWKSTSGSTASRATSPTSSVPSTASGNWPFTSATTTDRVEVDFPCDLTRARQLYAAAPSDAPQQTG